MYMDSKLVGALRNRVDIYTYFSKFTIDFHSKCGVFLEVLLEAMIGFHGIVELPG